jgi:hypothetical protein
MLATGLAERSVTMFLAIAVVLFVAWLLGLLAFHVTATALHLLLALAVIALIAHLMRRPSSV